MNKIKRMFSMAVVFMLCLVMVLSSCKKKERGQGEISYRRTDENVELNIWSYYSALQQEVFLKMVDEFNLGRGKDLNITVHVTNPGSMTDLETSLLSLTDKNFSQGSLSCRYGTLLYEGRITEFCSGIFGRGETRCTKQGDKDSAGCQVYGFIFHE